MKKLLGIVTYLLERQLFFMLLILIIVLSLFNENPSSGINKTVGWAWDVSTWIYWLRHFHWIILIGYVYFALRKYRTNVYISGIHVLLIVSTFIASKVVPINYYGIVFFFCVISIFLFVINCILIKKKT